MHQGDVRKGKKMKFAANLSFLYGEYALPERYAQAARDGFEGVEMLFPYDYAAAALKGYLDDAGLRQVLFNAPAGDWTAGERGTAILPGRRAEFRAGVERALEYAAALDCQRVHVLSGIAPAGIERAELEANLLENLAWAAAQAAAAGVRLQIEPINLRDMPGYFLTRQEQAHELVRKLGTPQVQVQMDLYHCQIMEGDVITKLRQYLPGGRVGHLQIAGVPARNEPDTGELRYEVIFGVLLELGYDGWLGCEYRPAGRTRDGLGWLQRARATAG